MLVLGNLFESRYTRTIRCRRDTIGARVTYHTVELATFVTLWLAAVVLCLSSTELAEVFSGLWHNILVQFHLNPAQFLPYQLKSVHSSFIEMQTSNADSK